MHKLTTVPRHSVISYSYEREVDKRDTVPVLGRCVQKRPHEPWRVAVSDSGTLNSRLRLPVGRSGSQNSRLPCASMTVALSWMFMPCGTTIVPTQRPVH